MKNSKFKQILKKALKYVVTPFALVCSIIGLYSINSYAYSTDTFSHTLTNQTNPSNYTYEYDLINPITNYEGDYFLLINCDISLSRFSTKSFRFSYFNQYNSWVNDSYVYTYINYPNDSFFTFVYDLNHSYNLSNDGSAYKIRFYLDSIISVINIDLVSSTELTTTYYLDTYVSSYQQQLAQLQNEYNTLSDNYTTLENNYDTLENNYNTLENNYNTLEGEYEQKQNEYDMLSNGQLGYLDYMEFYINNQSIEFGNDSESELNLNELIEYNLYANNSLNLAYFTTSEVNPNYYPLKIESYYNQLPVNLFSMYFNGGTTGIIKIGYYYNSQFLMKQISFDNTGTAIDSTNTSLINYEVFNGISVEYIEYIEIQFNNADAIAGSINFNSNYNIAYSTGYTNGYNYGYNVSDNINSEKIENARQEGYQNGYDTGNIEGYNRGYNEGSTQDISTNGFKTLITTILSYPVNMVKESLNFEFMGIHVASIVLFIVSLGIVAFVIKRFKD